MNMVGHQTISIENASRRERLSRYLIGWTYLLIQYRDEMRVVFFIIKNVLSVYTSKHHMIDTCSAGFSWTSCHILSQIFYKSKKYIANHQIIQKQNRTKGQTPCAMTSHNTKENPARNIPSEAFGYTIAQGVCPRVSLSLTGSLLKRS